MKTFKLAIAFLRERQTRAVLTTIATAAAVCMVIWVSSSYEALHKTYDEYANLALGRYSLAVAPISAEETDSVPPAVLQPLRADPAVVAVDPMWAQRLAIENSDGPPVVGDREAVGIGSGPGTGPRGQLPSLLFIATDSPEPPFEMVEGVWIGADASNGQSVVVRADVAQRRGIVVHDRISVELPGPSDGGETHTALQVVGIVNAPSLPGAEGASIPMLTPSSGEAFISIPLAEKISGEPFRISLLGLSIDPAADITQFRFGWAPRLSDYTTPLQFQEAFEIEEALDQASAAQNVRFQAYAATAVAMLVAMLVVFCSLSMGVTERIRQYAILRAIGWTRGQVGWLIVIEALALGSLGLGAGIVIGWSLLKTVEFLFGQLLYHGIGFGASSLTLATAAAVGGALLAAVIPIYRATRVKPIDAMVPRRHFASNGSIPWRSMVLGLLLISIGPLLTFVGPPPSESSVWFAMGGGLAYMAAGFIILAPSIVVGIDHLLRRPFAWLFRIDAKLLSSQITSNVWRTVGASVSMAFGLGLFVGIQVWGFTMLQAFIPGDWTPDAIAIMKPGLPPAQVAKVAALPDIDALRCLPLVVEQPRLVDDLTHSAERASVTRQDNVVIVGLDPQGAFAGEQPLLQLNWVAGTPKEAIAMMKLGHACVVPDHFLMETGLSLGDTISLDPPRNAGHTAEYKIAGAVRLPGWHWQTKLTGLRPRTHRAAALVFADYDSVASDFDLPIASHVWFSYANDSADVEGIESAIHSLLLSEQTTSTSDDDVSARVVPVQGIRDHLQGAARRWIWVTSVVPLLTLLIACLGVLNVILASVRARRWEFGVLRSIGFASSDLARAILVEGLMIAVVAGVLSVGFGVLIGWCGASLAQYISFFGGLHPPMVIPLLPIAAGLLLVLTLGILTAAWPAFSIRRSRPMDLLRSGGDFM